MGASRTEIDAWLHAGGLVVAASERAARAVLDQAQASASITPQVLAWKSFVEAAWKQHFAADSRLLLNPTQEQALWAGILAAEEAPHLPILLEGPRHRLARLAIEAHELLCSHAPQFLRARSRSNWQQDAAAFSGWLSAFDELCRAQKLIAPSRLPVELLPLLEADSALRPPLLLVGFDRILPLQRQLFDAWGNWREAAPNQPASVLHYHQAPDAQSELTACALWCRSQLAANSHALLLVITQNAANPAHRGAIERAFLPLAEQQAAPLFEFSLGIPLSRVALPKAAHHLLRWLSGSLAEHELDWLFSTGCAAASPQENSALQEAMRKARRRGQERTRWTLAAFLAQSAPPEEWTARIRAAQQLLAAELQRPQPPAFWADLTPRLLEAASWPGFRPLSSPEFQATQRWQLTVDAVGSLSFDGRRIRWPEFLSTLARTLEESLFAPESQNAPIQIAGPAESAGLRADALWFLSADEDSWPVGGAFHPLLPPHLQRDARMPHASAQLDWELAQAITTRLAASAAQVNFSYARQNATAEARPSRLIAQLAGAPQPLPPELLAPEPPPPSTELFEDFSRIPFPPGKVEGGSAVLTAQSQCPFKAFASARLGAQSWQPATDSLTPAQRGQLLHAVLHALWAGPPDGIRTLHDLADLGDDRPAFVAEHVRRVFQHELRPHLREQMPRRYLELEQLRLTALLTEWLDYEATRLPFEVAETESARTVHLDGLTFDLRLDRLDHLNDGTLLVIDYKTGNVTPRSWQLPRPEDVQLPLYAGFALDPEAEPLGGLVFAKLRAGDHAFLGRVADAKATLLDHLSGGNALVRDPLTVEQLIDWRAAIEQLARDFLAGHAEVDPRDFPATCQYCDLPTLCRVQENQNQATMEETDAY